MTAVALWAGLATPSPAAELRLGPASLSVIGQDVLAFRSEQIRGGATSRSAYFSDSTSSTGGFAHQTDLVVHGLLLPGLRLDAAFARGSYGTGRQRLTFTYEGDDAIVKVGDLAVAFDGNSLAAFRRDLSGVAVTSKWARGSMSLVSSTSRPSLRTETICGRNSAGPYYLTASPIVDASETIAVDGRTMQRGTDYSIDYQIGLIQFSAAMIIAPTSQITARYEYVASGQTAGQLIGLRVSYPVSSGVNLGTTYLTTQRSRSATASATTKEDRWQGNNSAGPFTLTYRPVEANSELVRLDGILQARGSDYQIDYTTGAIVFLQVVPAGATIIVSYDVSAVSGTATGAVRSLLGVDAHFVGAHGFSLDAEAAQSSGGVDVAGQAFSLAARGAWSQLTLAAGWRQAGAGFTSFESSDSRENCSSRNASLQYTPLQGLALSFSFNDRDRPYSSDDSSSNPLIHERNQAVALDFRRPGLPTLSYTGAWNSINGSGDESLMERTGSHLLVLGYDTSTFGLKATLRANSYARDGELPATSSYVGSYAAKASGASLNLRYRPAEAFNLTCDLARSGTTLAEGTRSDAGSARLAVEYAPGASTSISLGYSDSANGATTSLDGTSIPRSRNSSRALTIRHNASAALALNLCLDRDVSEGGYGTDSASTTLGGGFWWQCGPTLNLVGQYNRQSLAYLTGTAQSINNIASLSATIGPIGPGLRLQLSYNHMRGAASGSFDGTGVSDAITGMANSSAKARLSYALGHGREAFTEFETSRNVGYSGAARRTVTALGVVTDLGHGLTFTADWRRTASEAADASLSYRAQSLSGQLGVKF